MNRQQAVAVAGDVLLWYARQPEEMGHLLDATGMALQDVTSGSQDPTFLGFVLDFLLNSDEAVMTVAADLDLDPHVFAVARMALPGGEVMNWT